MTLATMVRIGAPGGPEVLEIVEREVRAPGAFEVRVRVHAAGLNRADIMQRRGLYPAPSGVPADVPGLEFAGEVEAIGELVTGWSLGARVMGIVGGGAMSTHVVVHERELLRIPERFSFDEAAAIPEVFLTVFDAVVLEAGVRAGESILVHAVGSGIGLATISLGRALGATVIGTSRTASKLERAVALGLHHPVLAETVPGTRDVRFADEVLARSGHGADVILDTIGASYLGENVRALAPRGRIVSIGLLGGATGELPLGALLKKRARLVGSVLRSRPLEEKLTLVQAFAREVLPRFDRGELAPNVEKVLSHRDIADAHRAMEKDETFGKWILRF